LQTAGDFFGKSALDYALFGGEDYQLLFTVEPEQHKMLEIADLGQELTVIGEITEGPAHVELVQKNGEVKALAARGYNHFG